MGLFRFSAKPAGRAARATRAARTTLATLVCSHAMAAHAVLITFDDLPPPDPEGGFASTPVTNEYASLGLVVDGYLGGSGVPGTNQVLYGAPTLSLSFIGASLPTYVSLYVSAPNKDKVFVDAAGPSDWGSSVVTGGFGGPPGSETPYRDNQYVSFHSASGISALNLTAFYFLRTGPVIDNLYFGNVAPVPEPGPIALWGAGLLTLAAAARRRRPRARRVQPG